MSLKMFLMIEVLVEAKASKLAVSQDVFDRGVSYIQNALNASNIDPSSMAYILYVSELSGVDQAGRIQTAGTGQNM